MGFVHYGFEHMLHISKLFVLSEEIAWLAKYCHGYHDA